MSKEEAYFRFLEDWSNKNLNLDFFNDNVDSVHNQVRNLSIWEETIRSSENMAREKSLFKVDSMNPKRIRLNKELSSCLAKESSSSGIRFFLLQNSRMRLSPKVAHSRLLRVSEYDLKNYYNRLAIVLGVYYQTAFNIN